MPRDNEAYVFVRDDCEFDVGHNLADWRVIVRVDGRLSLFLHPDAALSLADDLTNAAGDLWELMDNKLAERRAGQ